MSAMAPLPQPPIAGADKWLKTMERAASRCMCADKLCGTSHAGGRCPEVHSDKHKLVCVSFADTWLAACVDGELTALCRKCHLGWKRQLMATDDDQSGQEALF